MTSEYTIQDRHNEMVQAWMNELNQELHELKVDMYANCLIVAELQDKIQRGEFRSNPHQTRSFLDVHNGMSEKLIAVYKRLAMLQVCHNYDSHINRKEG